MLSAGVVEIASKCVIIFVVGLIVSKEQIRQLIKYFTPVLLFILLYGVITYFFKSNPLSFLATAGSSFEANGFVLNSGGVSGEERFGLTSRIMCFSDHPLSWGAITFSMLILYFYIFKRKILPSYLSISVCVLCFINLFFTGCRSALLSFVAAVVLYLFFQKHYKYLLALFILSFVIFVFNYDSVINTNDEVSGSSLEMRTDQMLSALDLFRGSTRALLFGMGNLWISDFLSKYGTHPDLLGFESILLHGVVSLGIIGCVCYTCGSFLYLFSFCKTSISKSFSLSFFLLLLVTGYYGLYTYFFALSIILRCDYILFQEDSKKLFNKIIMSNKIAEIKNE